MALGAFVSLPRRWTALGLAGMSWVMLLFLLAVFSPECALWTG